MNKNYEAVIGLEIHAELKTKSKMFCSCANQSRTNADLTQTNADKDMSNMRYAISPKPNENVCPVCLGMPGTLPVLNRQAIEMTIKTGLALNCKVNKFSKWDRKNYFYPDIPKGYQISQYDLPLVHDGYIEINSNFQFSNSKQIPNSNDRNPKQDIRKIRITRIHLEEDTATSKHPEGREGVDYSLVDFNRAGVPLMELVTKPDIRNAKEAKEFCKQYQLILRYLGVADADMEKGQMRCEANVSVRNIGNSKHEARNSKQIQNSNDQNSKQKLGIKVEVKNINSFRSVERAIEYEIERQIEALEAGEKIIQETRGWDEKKQHTYVMRVKETSADYRYFPEPDLPPIVIGENDKFQKTNNKQIQNSKFKNKQKTENGKLSTKISIEKIKAEIPELPAEKIKRYINDYQLSPKDAEVIVGNLEMMRYLEKIFNFQLPIFNHKMIVNYIINEVPELNIKPEYLIELVNLIDEGKISGKIAKEILPEIKTGKSPNEIIKEKGLEIISDTGELETIIDKILGKNSDAVAKIKAGQAGVMGFLVGQVMQETKGQANPQAVNEILRNKIG